MSESKTMSGTNEAAHGEAAAPSIGWRFRLGVGIFAAGCLTPLGVPLVAMTDLSTAMKATLSGLLLAGIPEVFSVVAIALLGKQGFAYVKARLLAVLRRYGPPKTVGRTRYYVGLTMFIVPAIFAWVVSYVPDWVPGYTGNRVVISLAIDVIFFSSFFVLGGDFWDKVRSLFVYDAKARFPEPAAG